MIIKVFGHFPQRNRRGSWWHSCIPKHRGGNYNEASIHFSDHKVCTWHQFKSSQAVVERDCLWPSLLWCSQCTLIYLGNYRNHRKQPNICFSFLFRTYTDLLVPRRETTKVIELLVSYFGYYLQQAWHMCKNVFRNFSCQHYVLLHFGYLPIEMDMGKTDTAAKILLTDSPQRLGLWIIFPDHKNSVSQNTKDTASDLIRSHSPSDSSLIRYSMYSES